MSSTTVKEAAGKEELEHMVNEVMENLDTFVLEPAPQVSTAGFFSISLRFWVARGILK